MQITNEESSPNEQPVQTNFSIAPDIKRSDKKRKSHARNVALSLTVSSKENW